MNDILILTLLNLPRVSRKTIINLLKNIDIKSLTLDNLLEILNEANGVYIRIPRIDKESLNTAHKKANEILLKSKNENINIITILDDDFPNKLKAIDDPPVILFYKGNKECILSCKSVAIIGTRTPTPQGQIIAEKLGKEFGKEQFVVVSGLAKGCDELAHLGCVEAKGKSIAVLPCGLDKVYPASNKPLAKSILDNDGALVSEYPIGHRPFKGSFIERDRLQSALSTCVIVVETNVVGGTMHTVEFTLKQKRLLACYNHEEKFLENKQTFGNQKLIKDNVALGIYSKNDIEVVKHSIIKKIDYMNNLKNEFNNLKTKEIQMKLI